MGRHLNLKIGFASIGFAALCVATVSTALPNQAQARGPQAYPAISLETPLARDADTFQGDRRLEAACRKGGQEKGVCLCVTHIMKYELTLSEYRAATRLYGQPANRTALYQSLKSEGFKTSEIHMAEEMERSLAVDDDFAVRCAEAKAYYRKPSQ